MNITTDFHYLVKEIVSYKEDPPNFNSFQRSFELNKSLQFKEILQSIEEYDKNHLGDLINSAFLEQGKPQIEEANVLLYQIGRFSYVFLVKPKDAPDNEGIIIQIGKNKKDTLDGRVIESDYTNLKKLQETKCKRFVPPTLSKLDEIKVGNSILPLFFTEYLGDYHELNYNHSYLESYNSLFTNRPENEHINFSRGESAFIMKEIVKIIALTYASTYSPNNNKGLLLGDIKIDAGDFVYNSLYSPKTSYEKPLVKMITARRLEKAHPRQLLNYLLSPTEVSFNMTGRVMMGGFILPNEKSSIYLGIMDALNEIYGKEAKNIFNMWKQDYKTNLELDFVNIFKKLNSNEIKSFDDIPIGYDAELGVICFEVDNRIKDKIHSLTPDWRKLNEVFQHLKNKDVELFMLNMLMPSKFKLIEDITIS